LDSEIILKQFEQIEQRVENLIDVCKSLESDNLSLKAKVEQLEADLLRKTEAETKYEQEKALVKSKIDGLLAKFDFIEEN
jgi:cell division protein ZapB